MKFEFLPDFKGLRFKPEQYRRMMKIVARALSWIVIVLVIAVILLRLKK